MYNTRNKSYLIKLLSKYLKEDGLTVINCDDGADTQVVETVLDFACKKKTNVTVFPESTSIFLLLLYFWNSDMGKVFMKANKKYQIQNLMSIRKIAERLNRVIVKDILFINAWSGCGSTSALFNKDKTALIKLIDLTCKNM